MIDSLENAVENLLKSFDEDKLTVQDCENFINEVPRFTVKHGIAETRKFLEYLGNPDENMKNSCGRNQRKGFSMLLYAVCTDESRIQGGAFYIPTPC